jgi:hypothetical protein
MNYCINNPNRSFIIGDSHYDCHPLYSKYGYVTANNDNKCPSNYKVLNGLGICSTNNLLSMCISPNIYSPNFSQANILYPSVKYNNMCPYNWTRVNICNGEPVKRVKNYYDTIQPTQTISNQGIPNMCLCTIS